MPKSVTASKNAQALARYNESLESARRYANLSRASSTWKAYASDWKIFDTWCRSVAAVSLPALPETVAGFLASEADAGRAVSTLRRRLSAIRLMHIASDLPSPHESKRVTLVLKGIANDKKNRKPKKAKPALDADIKRMVDAMITDSAQGLRDRALLLVGFDGALRRSELVSLTVEMIERRDEGMLIDLPYSKTDQQGDGQIVSLLARAGSRYCPVQALDAWLTYSDCKTGLVFKRLRKGSRIDTTGLTAQSVSLIIKASLERAGYPIEVVEKSSGHSLRRGVMTDTARAGASVAALMQLGRHKKVDTAMGYVERETTLKCHPAKTLLQ